MGLHMLHAVLYCMYMVLEMLNEIPFIVEKFSQVVKNCNIKNRKIRMSEHNI
jgi:hypothetical protein